MLRAQINIVEVLDSWQVNVSLFDRDCDGRLDPIAYRSDNLSLSTWEQASDPLEALWSALDRVLLLWRETSHK
jgi:hypothetical protein